MTGSRKLLIFGGMALAAFGLLYGLQYALFVEHQTLDHMGGSLAQSFSAAASRNLAQSQAALEQYGETKYDYVRQVDAHSHWIGLAMLMIVLGVIFERVNFSEGIRQLVAFSLLAGSALFPLAVILQTYHHGAAVLRALAVVGSALVIAALAATAWGFARPRTAA
jgi:FtsH-binding integral membrane protein